ncbi:MAG: hypothetical protein NVS9B15_09010 [Acidobacteriaceae bacterium]
MVVGEGNLQGMIVRDEITKALTTRTTKESTAKYQTLSTFTAVPYASTSVTPCITSVAS